MWQVADAEKYAAVDAQLKQKSDARRALEDLIFDFMVCHGLILRTLPAYDLCPPTSLLWSLLF